MVKKTYQNLMSKYRILFIGLIGMVVVIGLSVIMLAIGNSAAVSQSTPVNALSESKDECIQCHSEETPGIVEQFGRSTMAAAEVSCRDCHEVEESYPSAIEHEGDYILAQPTSAKCDACHEVEVAQFYQSRHALPAYVAYAGAESLPAELKAQYEEIHEGGFDPSKSRNTLHYMEGPEVTRFACESCHNIGKPAPDDSVGQCQKCHLRHEFSLTQVRKPETCNFCHIGPDHPQFEIYTESPHGIAYATNSDYWNWEADAGTLTVEDFLAPTCSICHISGFGKASTTHDVGERLTWFLFAPVSERRPNWEENKERMQNVCSECHNAEFVSDFYADGDALVGAINAWVEESREIIRPLQEQGLLTEEPFDEPIDFVFFELWHHWGRTAKFGAWMQGPDYTQWHGAYEVLSDLAELREIVEQKLNNFNPGE